MILVVSRDIMIVAAVIVSWLFDKPVEMKPSMVSKLNTVAQVAFAALVLASLAFGFKPAPYDMILMGFVTVFTLVFRVALSRRVGAAHEHDRSQTSRMRPAKANSLDDDLFDEAGVRHGAERAWQAAFTPTVGIFASARGEPDPGQFSRGPGQCRRRSR